MEFSELVKSKAANLICHLHAYGSVDLTEEEWKNIRMFASFLFQEVEEESGATRAFERYMDKSELEAK